jgi:hypothetical protein
MSPGDVIRLKKLDRLAARHRAGQLERERDGLRSEMILYAKRHRNYGPDRVCFEELNTRLKFIIAEHAALMATINRLNHEIAGP